MNWNKIKKILLNKYVIATLVFLVIIVFIDDYSLRLSSKLAGDVRERHDTEKQLAQAIRDDSVAAANIRSSIDAKEHYGRENYYMKRSDEDIFVIK